MSVILAFAMQMDVQTFNRLNPVSEVQWNHLFQHSLNSANVVTLLEKFGLPGFEFHSILVSLAKKPVLLLPVFAMEYDITTTMSPALASKLSLFRRIMPWLLKPRVLRVGMVDQFVGQIGYDDTLALNILEQAWDFAFKALERLARSKRADIIAFTEFIPDTGAILPVHKLNHYSCVQGAPACVLSVKFPNVESYLNTLDSDLRRYLKRALRDSAAIDFVQTTDPSFLIERIYELYLGQVARSDLHLNGTKPVEYFRDVCALDSDARYFLYFADQQLIAFELIACRNGALLSRFIGMDPEAGRRYKIYFRSMIELVKYAIENEIETINLSNGMEDLKSRMGASVIVPSYTFFRHRNPLLHYLLARMKNELAYKSTITIPHVELGSAWINERMEKQKGLSQWQPSRQAE